MGCDHSWPGSGLCVLTAFGYDHPTFGRPKSLLAFYLTVLQLASVPLSYDCIRDPFTLTLFLLSPQKMWIATQR